MKNAPIKSIMSYKFITDLSPKRPSPKRHRWTVHSPCNWPTYKCMWRCHASESSHFECLYDV